MPVHSGSAVDVLGLILPGTANSGEEVDVEPALAAENDSASAGSTWTCARVPSVFREPRMATAVPSQ
jgi:hypothetical protein